MHVIIPMAGEGCRFVNAGYIDPKPLIEIRDAADQRRSIIEHVLDMFQQPDDHFTFICNESHWLSTRMPSYLRGLNRRVTAITIPPHKLGPVYTVMRSTAAIRDGEELIIAYCDGTLGRDWGRDAFTKHVHDNNLDGCLLTHTGFHPHALSLTTKMAFIKEHDGLVLEVKEKASYTDNPAAEHASSGVYYFRDGRDVRRYFSRMLSGGLGAENYNGEYYITLAYNPMIRAGLRIGYFDTPHAAILGTPDEVRNFEAWAAILRGSQVRSEEDLLRCYRYWKEYHGVQATG